MSVVSGYLMAGALTGSSSNWNVQKIAEAVNQNWIVTLDAVLFLSQQQYFRDQMGRLQEEIEAANHLIIFYPKFHCELNIIERFWCAAKWYARENYKYPLERLRKIVPAALNSITAVSIYRYYNHCARVIDAYTDGYKYGTQDSTAPVYKGYQQVVDKTDGKPRILAVIMGHSTFRFGFRR